MGRVTGLVNGICRATCPGCIPHGCGKLDSLRYIFAIMIAIMSDRLRKGLIVTVAGVLLVAAAWWALPRLAAALPGRVRHYVPEALARAHGHAGDRVGAGAAVGRRPTADRRKPHWVT